ncbi:SDR family NAD(P)-dependent oxidoreductase [Roseateles sp. BYS180W]|uniref:SDR family NAD(P)-dependent oxidoreductase n=1 Tax=Roseateles rivi TaxID=3299028 RepID=A0ABW7FS14_9BURK
MSRLCSPLNPPLRDWRGLPVWLIGASSGIGRATAHALHARGAKVLVSARHSAALQEFCNSHEGSQALMVDVTDAEAMRRAAHSALAFAQALGHPAPALVAYCAGHYRAQQATQFDLAEMQRHLAVNYSGALHLLDAMLPALLQAGRGHLSLMGSVAGYRGLPLSLAYGPTKAALHHLAECLHLELRPLGLGVSIVSPGFVDTPLTQQNHFHMPSLISPEQAAEALIHGWERGHFDIHFPRRFTLWMQLLRHLPDAWYFAAVRRATQGQAHEHAPTP